MKSRLLLLIFSLIVLIACGGKKSSTSTPANSTVVILTPATASVPINTTAQFTATVTNSSSGVYWSVNGVIGGNTSTGTISTSGLYTAPAVIPSKPTVTVTATSVADTTQVSSAVVTITSGTALTLSIAPSTASVFTARTQQFTATFNITTNTGVIWQVNSVSGGDSTHGTITSGGLYTAPATVPSPATVTITAISQADTSKTATATVTIVAGTVISVSPQFVTVPAGGTQTFSATANSAAIPVTWTLSCNSSQPGACGSITSAGVYTAPPFPPPDGGAAAITASSTDAGTSPSGANVVVQISNGSLHGVYAFTFAGKSGSTAYVAGGSVTFDGNGNISGGSEDVNNGTITSPAISGGTYHVGTDGRGDATVQTSAGTETWQIVLKDNTQAFVISADTTVTGNGALYLQDANQFASSSLSGKYALQLSGATAGQAGSAAYAGAFTADGAGTISAGKLDISSGTTVSAALALTGGYTAPAAATGRGTFTLVSSDGTQNFAYYLVNTGRALLVELDTSKVLRGEIVQQGSGPFSLSTFSGSYAMVVSGSNAQGPIALGSVLALDGTGSLTSGSADINANGSIQTQSAVTGTYAVTDTATGRTEATLTIGGQARKFAFYPESAGIATVLEIDGVQTTVGRAYLQAVNASFPSVFLGTYATTLAGTDFVTSPGEEDIVGLMTPNGGSAITGTLAINDNGTIANSAAVQASYLSSTPLGRSSGTITTNSNTLATGQMVYYVVDSNRVLLLEIDSNRALVGIMEKP